MREVVEDPSIIKQNRESSIEKRIAYVVSCLMAIKNPLDESLIYKPEKKIKKRQVAQIIKAANEIFQNTFPDYSKGGYCKVFAYFVAHCLKFYYKLKAGVMLTETGEHTYIVFHVEDGYYYADAYGSFYLIFDQKQVDFKTDTFVFLDKDDYGYKNKLTDKIFLGYENNIIEDLVNGKAREEYSVYAPTSSNLETPVFVKKPDLYY